MSASASPLPGARVRADSGAGDAPLIRLRGITRVYGQGPTALQALRGVDLDVERGEFVAIMGPSGSGKSTAMNLIGCLDHPSTGTMTVMGVDVSALDRTAAAAFPPVVLCRYASAMIRSTSAQSGHT